MANKKIIHIDMDCFYAAVEMRDFPEYRDVPLLIGHDGSRSVVSTCNYLAREYGIRSAMPVMKAKQLCPHVTIVNGRMSVYKEVSKQIREIFLRYTDKIEPLSLDEAYLDVTDASHCNGSATLIAEEIRQAIFSELNLTASAGVAPNKFIAKIASDENKPNGICVISPDKVEQFVEHLALKKIPGIGPKTAQRLSEYGFNTCADIRQSKLEQLFPILGKNAESLYRRSFGIDNREVVTHRERKSIGVERTFAEDLITLSQCHDVIASLYEKLQHRYLPYQSRLITKQGIKLKFNDFNQTTLEQQGSELNIDIFKALLTKAFERSNGRAIRLVGLTLGLQTESVESKHQLSLTF